MQEVAAELQTSIIEQNTFYVSIASCAISLLLLLLTGISVYFAYRAYQHQRQRAYKEAACRLAKTYVQEIIEKYDFISNALESSGFTGKIKTAIPYDRLHYFTMNELKSILKSKNIDYTSFDSEISQMNEGLSAHIKMMLNSLELFAMSCRYKLADEKMLYQPLHDSFLSYMWLFSFYICKINVNSEDKMYTNSIYLFNLWRKRFIDIENKIDQQAEDNIYESDNLE